MKRDNKRKIKKFLIVLIILVIFAAGFIIGSNSVKTIIINQNETNKSATINETIIEMGIPAVDNRNIGVVGKLVTSVRPGSGLVLVNVDNVLAQYDTQYSGRIAAKVAGDFTKINMSKLDVVYNIKVNASIIEGPSAGATMALSIILALQKKQSNSSIMITGTISENGTIGPVGSVYEKAVAAKNASTTLFIVPMNQSIQLGYRREKTCRSLGLLEYCIINYKTEEAKIGEILNITVAEAKDIEEAVKLFTQDQI